MICKTCKKEFAPRQFYCSPRCRVRGNRVTDAYQRMKDVTDTYQTEEGITEPVKTDCIHKHPCPCATCHSECGKIGRKE